MTNSESKNQTDKKVNNETQRKLTDQELVLKYMPDAATFKLKTIRLPSSVADDPNAPYAFCFCGIEGFMSLLKPMTVNINANVIGIQLYNEESGKTFEELTQYSVQQIENIITPADPVNIIAYSWGSIIGIETMSALENKGYEGTLTLIDGAPDLVKELFKKEVKSNFDDEEESVILCKWMSLHIPYDKVKRSMNRIFNCSTLQGKISVLRDICKDHISEEYVRIAAPIFLDRTKQVTDYKPKYKMIKSPTRLLKPTKSILSTAIAEDYNLSDLCKNFTGVEYFEETHITLLQNAELAETVNAIIQK